MCVCIHTTCRPADTNHKSVYLRIYTSTYTRTVEVGWRVRRMVNHDRVQSERAGLEDSIRHVQFYNYNQTRSEILTKVIKCHSFTIHYSIYFRSRCWLKNLESVKSKFVQGIRSWGTFGERKKHRQVHICYYSRKNRPFWKFASKIRKFATK